MVVSFNLMNIDGLQVIPINGCLSGSVIAHVGFDVDPTAGDVSLEIKRPGANRWIPVNGGAERPLSSGGADFSADGGIAYARVKFTGLVGGSSPRITFTENPTMNLPSDILTDDAAGIGRRMKVEEGNSAFASGKQFKVVDQYTLPLNGTTTVLRISTPVDILLWQSANVYQGAADVQLLRNGGATGTWTEKSIVGVNTMSSVPQPPYEPKARVLIGGTHTVAYLTDRFVIRTAMTNANTFTVPFMSEPIGLPAGEHFITMRVPSGGVDMDDECRLIHTVYWEEL